MKRYWPQFCFSLLVLVAAITLACGSSHGNLQSISVSPAAADAQNYPNEQVQFTATGYYGSSSSPGSVSPTWIACSKTGATPGITVSATGVGRCKAGASGTYYVDASVRVPENPQCNVELACFESGQACGGVQGVATLTCP